MAGEAGRSLNRGRVYVLDAQGKPQAVPVRVGVSDGSMTELLLGPNAAAELQEGTEVLVGARSGPGGAGAPPVAGGRPRPPF